MNPDGRSRRYSQFFHHSSPARRSNSPSIARDCFVTSPWNESWSSQLSRHDVKRVRAAVDVGGLRTSPGQHIWVLMDVGITGHTLKVPGTDSDGHGRREVRNSGDRH